MGRKKNEKNVNMDKNESVIGKDTRKKEAGSNAKIDDIIVEEVVIDPINSKRKKEKNRVISEVDIIDVSKDIEISRLKKELEEERYVREMLEEEFFRVIEENKSLSSRDSESEENDSNKDCEDLPLFYNTNTARLITKKQLDQHREKFGDTVANIQQVDFFRIYMESGLLCDLPSEQLKIPSRELGADIFIHVPSKTIVDEQGLQEYTAFTGKNDGFERIQEIVAIVKNTDDTYIEIFL